MISLILINDILEIPEKVFEIGGCISKILPKRVEKNDLMIKGKNPIKS